AQWQVTESMTALAEDPAVAAVGLAVDLVTEFDDDRSYIDSLLEAARRTSKPLAVLANIPAAVDPDVAAELRRAGIPVLEGAGSGLRALRHLLEHATPPFRAAPPPVDQARRGRWAPVIAAGEASGPQLFALLRDYGISVSRVLPARDPTAALAAAAQIGYPVVLKTGEAGVAHKAGTGGVGLGIDGPAAPGRGVFSPAARPRPPGLRFAD